MILRQIFRNKIQGKRKKINYFIGILGSECIQCRNDDLSMMHRLFHFKNNIYLKETKQSSEMFMMKSIKNFIGWFLTVIIVRIDFHHVFNLLLSHQDKYPTKFLFPQPLLEQMTSIRIRPIIDKPLNVEWLKSFSAWYSKRVCTIKLSIRSTHLLADVSRRIAMKTDKSCVVIFALDCPDLFSPRIYL